MNPAWRFYKGKIEGAEQKNFDDKKWDIAVSYTHLDVYKRQVFGSFAKRTMEGDDVGTMV